MKRNRALIQLQGVLTQGLYLVKVRIFFFLTLESRCFSQAPEVSQVLCREKEEK